MESSHFNILISPTDLKHHFSRNFAKNNFFSTQETENSFLACKTKKRNVFSSLSAYRLNTGRPTKPVTSQTTRTNFGDKIRKTCGSITYDIDHPCNLQFKFDKKVHTRDVEDQFDDKAATEFLKSQRNFRIESSRARLIKSKKLDFVKNMIDKY